MKELPNKTYLISGIVVVGLLALGWSTVHQVSRAGIGAESDPHLSDLVRVQSPGTELSPPDLFLVARTDLRFPLSDELWILSPLELLLLQPGDGVEFRARDLPGLYRKARLSQGPTRAFLSLEELDLARRWAVLLASGRSEALLDALDAGASRGLPSGKSAGECRWLEIEALYRRIQASRLESAQKLVEDLSRCPQARLHSLWLKSFVLKESETSKIQALLEELRAWSMDPNRNDTSRNLAHLMRRTIELRFH
jgi:hypothetical protein